TMDALFSTGIGHSLTAAQRLARILTERREGALLREWYAPALRREVDYIDRLVSGAYRAMPDFPVFAAWGMLYFAGAIAAEERRRRGEGKESDEFLSSHLPHLRRAVEEGIPESPAERAAFAAKVAQAVAPVNTTGLCDPAKRNVYPY